jgi:hypothetical protein
MPGDSRRSGRSRLGTGQWADGPRIAGTGAASRNDETIKVRPGRGVGIAIRRPDGEDYPSDRRRRLVSYLIAKQDLGVFEATGICGGNPARRFGGEDEAKPPAAWK